ncbi:hypothetical protein K431DRAFT_282056 [Polychaeton citri CBS 116435]|uniref:DUF7702 domain-containing protein n=1 Tax=Polychaeton citri CBS 116435 TaxID=1314669 RepID=A0A9P4QEK7_9PEZI|nr:hypothetical protein K431DRAFT_282056 [Polychaeton citri CBS 116435]
MSLTPKSDLSIAMLVFYCPALVLSSFIIFKHGLKRQLGWFYLVLLSLLRVIGSSTSIYMAVNNDYSSGLVETSIITSAVGTAPLISALLGFQNRVHDGMEPHGVSPSAFRMIQLLVLPGIILSIVGGTKLDDTDASDVHTGLDCLKASSIIFLVLYLVLAVICCYAIMRVRWVRDEEKPLMRACVLSLPFLLVRIVHTVCAGFSQPGDFFYFGNANVWAEAFMMFAMEAICVSLYAFAGLKTPKMEEKQLLEGDYEESSYGRMGNGVEMESQQTGHARHEGA